LDRSGAYVGCNVIGRQQKILFLKIKFKWFLSAILWLSVVLVFIKGVYNGNTKENGAFKWCLSSKLHFLSSTLNGGKLLQLNCQQRRRDFRFRPQGGRLRNRFVVKIFSKIYPFWRDI
jgi:hypothetical protein